MYNFTYHRPGSARQAANLLGKNPEAKLLAGGHSLIPVMKLRLANPEHLVDINDLTDLAYIREEAGVIKIGALTRHVDLLRSDLLAQHFPHEAVNERAEHMAAPVASRSGEWHEAVPAPGARRRPPRRPDSRPAAGAPVVRVPRRARCARRIPCGGFPPVPAAGWQHWRTR